MITRLCEGLGLGPIKISSFLKLQNQTDNPVIFDEELLQLEDDIFTLISDWYHMAIVELTETDDFSYDVSWVSKRLGISSLQASDAIERLLRLEVLVENDGTLKKAKKPFSSNANFSTTASKKLFQKQIFEKATTAIDDIDYKLRKHSGVTFAIDTDKLDEMKSLASQFQTQLMQLLSEQNETKKDQVYHFALALFPLTKLENKNEGDGSE